MRFHRSTLSVAACVAFLVIEGEAAAQPLALLVELSAQRLDISRRVALVKWDSNAPVADPPGDPREGQVIAAAVEEATQRGLSAELAAGFFADQIEASKLKQFSLMANWRRTGSAPAEARADLKGELRPALDRLGVSLVEALVATEPLRQDPACRLEVAKATAIYVTTHQRDALDAVALDRGLARACGN